MPNSANTPRRTLLLTGASRGIGHATVIRFSSAGWRVITCSRHSFPEDCPWDAGPEDHIQVDLADHADTTRAISDIRQRLEGGALHALVNNAAISPKTEGGEGLGGQRHLDRGLPRPSLRRRRLCDLEGGAGLVDPRDGLGFRPHRRPRQFDRARRNRHLDPVAGHRENRRPADPAASAGYAG